jgi:predicted transcriptional regulator of viral defense system
MGVETQKRGREVGVLATRQHGVVARRQALGLGFSARQIEARLASGWLLPLRRDVYAVGHLRISRRGQWMAAVLACGPDAVLSHESAACFWGLQGDRPAIDVNADCGRQGQLRREGVRLHRCKLRREECAVENRIPVTSVARTVFDLAEVVGYERLKGAAEEADRLKLLRLSELERVVEQGRGRRALKPIRRLLHELRAPPRTRSSLEDRFHDFCESHRLPPPATNVHVLGHEVDALWPGAKLVVELDSWEFHAHRAAFQRDRAYDSERLVAGYRTVRVTHDRLDREAGKLLAELRALLGVALE